MRIVVTGSSGHLGEGLGATLRARGVDVVGIDLRPGVETNHEGSICDRDVVRDALSGADAVVHTATLHKPHIATHSRHAFVETNVTGTLNLLEASVAAGVGRFVFTSTTSTFGRALIPDAGAPAAWITEEVTPLPKNIYGATKLAAEHLCELFHRQEGLDCLVLRTSRFFPDEDDRRSVRDRYADANLKANEYLYRRVDLGDAVDAHVSAVERAAEIGFGRYIISATTPLVPEDLPQAREHLPDIVGRIHPRHADIYDRLGWKMFAGIDRIYVNTRARRDLDWTPRVDFGVILDRLEAGEDIWSPLARAVGIKRYHDEDFDDGPYPVMEPGPAEATPGGAHGAATADDPRESRPPR